MPPLCVLFPHWLTRVLFPDWLTRVLFPYWSTAAMFLCCSSSQQFEFILLFLTCVSIVCFCYYIIFTARAVLLATPACFSFSWNDITVT